MKELRFANADGTIDITYLVDLIGTNDDCTVYDVIQKVNRVLNLMPASKIRPVFFMAIPN